MVLSVYLFDRSCSEKSIAHQVLFMNKDSHIGSEVIVEPLSGLCWKVYTAMRTVTLIDRTAELATPARIV